MIDVMFIIFEISLIMSIAILLLMFLSKLLGNKITAPKRFMIWVCVAVALLMPIRPFMLTLPSPAGGNRSEEGHQITASSNIATHAGTMVSRWEQFRQEDFEHHVLFPFSPPSNYNESLDYYSYHHLDSTSSAQLSEDESSQATSAPAQMLSPYAKEEAIGMSAETSVGMSIEIPARIPLGSLNLQHFLSLIHVSMMTLWIFGGLGFALFWIIRHQRFTNNLRKLWIEVNHPNALGALEQIKADLNLKQNISLMSCSALPTPIVIGLFRPKIVLPSLMLEGETLISCNSKDTQHSPLYLALLHEAFHIKRRDLYTRLLCLLALGVHWFNPLVHWMARKTNEEAELATDHAVLAHLGVSSRFQYGEMLLSVTRLTESSKANAPLVFGFNTSGKKLKRRLENIVKSTPVPRCIALGCTFLLLSITIGFSMVGCSTIIARGASLSHIIHPDRSLFAGETLTIATTRSVAISPYVNQYRAANLDINVEIICFREEIDNGNLSGVREQLGDLLLAGTGPVLIDGWLIDYLDPRLNHLFIDWFPIMEADPEFNEADWFMNIFHATAVEDRLLAFPTKFSYRTASANGTVPYLAEALMVKDSVTLLELMELQQQLQPDTPFYIGHCFDSSMFFEYHYHDFLNFETGWVDFDNQQFIDAITHAKEATRPNQYIGWRGGYNNIHPRTVEPLTEQFLFGLSIFNMGNVFLDFDPDYPFRHLTPITNDQEELMVTIWQSFALSVHASPVEQAIAWDFIKFIMNPDHQGFGQRTLMIPTNKDLFHYGMKQQAPESAEIIISLGWQIGDEDEAIDRAIARVNEIVNMPMTTTGRRAFPYAIYDMVFEVLERFHEGEITAQQAASELQYQVTIAMEKVRMN